MHASKKPFMWLPIIENGKAMCTLEELSWWSEHWNWANWHCRDSSLLALGFLRLQIHLSYHQALGHPVELIDKVISYIHISIQLSPLRWYANTRRTCNICRCMKQYVAHAAILLAHWSAKRYVCLTLANTFPHQSKFANIGIKRVSSLIPRCCAGLHM